MAIELQELLSTDYDILAVVQDGAALIEAARRALPDAIVSDIAMPHVNGLAAAASILVTRPDARIVFVTVQDSRGVIRKAIDCGARGDVLKGAAVRTALEGGFYFSTNARRFLGKPGRPPANDGEGS